MTSSAAAVQTADQPAASAPEVAKVAFAFVWLFTFTVFGRPEDIFHVLAPFRLTLLSGGCAGLAYMGALVFGRIRLQSSRELVLVLLLTAWFALGIPFAFYRRGSFDGLTQEWVKRLLFFFLLTQTLTSVDRVRKILWAVLLSELMASGASILLEGKEALQEGERLAGLNTGLLGWNFLGITASVTLPYVAFLYVSRRSALRTGLLLAVIGSTIWMIMLTASRGGFLGIILSLPLTWWLVLRRSRRSRILAVLLTLFLLVALVMAPNVFWLRLQTIGSSSPAVNNTTSASAEASVEGRIFLLKQSIRYTLQFPILGVGIGNFPVYNAGQFQRPDAWLGTHNTFTQLSSEAGIPALALFLLLLGTVFRQMRKISNDLATDPAIQESRLLARATMVSLVLFVFSGFLAHLAYDYLFYLVVGIGTGLWSITRLRREVFRSASEPHEVLPTLGSTKWSSKWR